MYMIVFTRLKGKRQKLGWKGRKTASWQGDYWISSLNTLW
jgi:hypothetical protein